MTTKSIKGSRAGLKHQEGITPLFLFTKERFSDYLTYLISTFLEIYWAASLCSSVHQCNHFSYLKSRCSQKIFWGYKNPHRKVLFEEMDMLVCVFAKMSLNWCPMVPIWWWMFTQSISFKVRTVQSSITYIEKYDKWFLEVLSEFWFTEKCLQVKILLYF